MLKQLMLRKKIEQRKSALSDLMKDEQAIVTRSAELESSIEEAATEEEVSVVEQEISAIETEKKDLSEKKSKLEGEITELEGELEKLNANEPQVTPKVPGDESQRHSAIVEGGLRMKNFFKGMTRESVQELLVREEVKDFLTRARGFIGQKRAVSGSELTIPDVMLELLRDNLHRYSKLIGKINLRPLKGKARQNIAGTIPEAIWTEMCGKLNELAIAFNQIEMDGYKIGGFIPICNATLEDSDLNLASEILDALGQSLGLGVDKAIVYGLGTKMPLGIAPRLAQTAKPSDWGINAPAWTDLHLTNIIKLDLAAKSAAEFFEILILKLGIARPNFSTGGTFWVMNRKTKLKLMSKSIAFNAAGAIVASQMSTMPIEGGDIIELDFMPDDDIIGGFGSLYLLAERSGAQLAVSEHVRFLEDQTVFKGTARYDGAPVFGESFVLININNVTPTTVASFAPDDANIETP